MIKIERLKDGAKVYVTRNGQRVQVFLNQLITHEDFASVEVEGGTLVYSVDETEVLEITGGAGKQIELNLSETVQDAVVTTETVEVETAPAETPAETLAETPAEVPTQVTETTIAAAPVIVQPAPRAKK